MFSSEFYTIHLIFIFWLGLMFGSFLNVCIYRIPCGLSIVSPGSHCFSCGTPIKWYDNVPLLSYVMLLGRCRHCGAAFSPRYFMIELLTGVLFALTFHYFGYSLATPVYIVFICLLVVGTFTDIDHWIIPDGVTLGGALFGLVGAGLLAGFFPKGFLTAGTWPFYGTAFYAPFLNSLAGALAGAVMIYAIGFIGTVIFRKEAMGFGDVKLFLLIGAVMGPLNCIYVLMLASVLGSFIGGGAVLYGKMKARKRKAAAPETPDQDAPHQRDAPPEEETERAGKNEEEAEEAESEESPEEREERIINGTIRALEEMNEKSPPGRLHHIPFGPFIALGAIIWLYWGRELSDLIFRLQSRIFGLPY